MTGRVLCKLRGLWVYYVSPPPLIPRAYSTQFNFLIEMSTDKLKKGLHAQKGQLPSSSDRIRRREGGGNYQPLGAWHGGLWETNTGCFADWQRWNKLPALEGCLETPCTKFLETNYIYKKKSF